MSSLDEDAILQAPPADAPHWLGTASAALASAITILGIAWAIDLPGIVGVIIFREQMLAAILACTLALMYLRFPARRHVERTTVPWYDVSAAIAGLLVGGYVALRYPTIARDFFYMPTETFVVGFLLIGLLIEALRRATGLALVIIMLVFIVYGLVADWAPGYLRGRPQPFTELISYLGLDSVALLGIPLYVITTIVIVYVFMGQLLLLSGGASFFTDLALSLMGRYRGGSAKIAVLSSALFGTISGSAVSNVATTGVLTIPMMKAAGYKPRVAAAVEATASTGGQLMPPIMGAAAFLIAEFLQIHYREVMVAAIVPAFLYYLALLVQADLTAAREGIKPLPSDQLPRARDVLREGWYLVIPFVILIYALFYLNLRAETAALTGAATIAVLGFTFSYKGIRLRPRDIVSALRDAGLLSAEMVVIGAMAGIVIGIIQVTGLGFGLTFMLVQFGEQSLLLLLVLTAAICIVLGMGLPTTAVYFLLASLVAAPMIKLGLEPLAAHLFLMYFGMMSMITPPVAFAAFAAAGIARADPMETGWTACVFGWPAFVIPFMFVYSPTLILIGSPVDVGFAFLTACAGVYFCSAGIMGYFLERLTPVRRALFVVTGILLLTPAHLFPGAIWLDIAGIVIAPVLAWVEYRSARLLQADSPVKPVA